MADETKQVLAEKLGDPSLAEFDRLIKAKVAGLQISGRVETALLLIAEWHSERRLETLVARVEAELLTIRDHVDEINEA